MIPEQKWIIESKHWLQRKDGSKWEDISYFQHQHWKIMNVMTSKKEEATRYDSFTEAQRVKRKISNYRKNSSYKVVKFEEESPSFGIWDTKEEKTHEQ